MADEHDFAILCAIQATPLEGPASWARQVGTDVATVRRRIRHLERVGVLRGFAATPTAAAFGRTQVPHQFHCDAPPDMDAILAIEDVAWAASTLDGRVFVNTFEDRTPRRAELEQLLGPNQDSFEASTEPGPEVLGRIELKVLRALLLEPRASIVRLAEITGLSNKTVQHHRARLIARHLVRIDPLLRPPTEPGRLFYHMSLHIDDASRVESVAKAIPDSTIVSLFRAPPAAYLFCTAAGIAEQAAHQKAVESVPGVHRVMLLINEGYGLATKRLVGWCDALIAEWDQASRERP